MKAEDLDGRYRVTTISDYQGPVPMHSDGETVIKNGTTNRVDAAGCRWTTKITPLNEAEVEFVSVADPADATPDFCLTLPNGDLTRAPVTYTAVLKIQRKDGRLKLSGQIEHGKILTIITMIKLS